MTNPDESEKKELRDQVIKDQTYAGVFLGSVLGASCGTAVYAIFWWGVGIIPMIFFLAPGFVSGYITKFTGKAFELKFRSISGLVTMLFLVFFSLFVDGSQLAK